MSFQPSVISTKRPFEKIHCDIWGPYRVPTHSGAQYFLTIVDDFTRYTWIHLMHFKSESQRYLRSFFSFVQTQFETRIQQIQVDNGGEFYSMKDFFLEQGVIYQTSCVRTPQQNGVVERKHRHILNVA